MIVLISQQLFMVAFVGLLAVGIVAARAGQIVEDAGDLVCVVDTWDEKKLGYGHKMAEAASRCVIIPDDATAAKATEDCKVQYEYLPDGSWTGKGTCTDTYAGGDKAYLTREEGSHLKEYKYTKTGGTGKYQGVSGSGTYTHEKLTDTLSAGRYQGRLLLK